MIEVPKERLLAIWTIPLSMHTLFIALMFETVVYSFIPYIIGTTLGLAYVYFLIIFGEESTSRLKILLIATLGIVTIAFLIIYITNFDYFYMLFGSVPSFLLIFSRLVPLNIEYNITKTDRGYVLTKNTNYTLGSTSIQREFGKNTTFRLVVQPQGLVTLSRSGGHFQILYIQDPGKIDELIEFAPLRSRGILVLSKLLSMAPPTTMITTNRLDRPTGGLLSGLEPKIGSVTIRKIDLNGEQDYDKIVAQINRMTLKKELVPSKYLLSGQILWGIFITTITGIFTFVIGMMMYIEFLRSEYEAVGFLIFGTLVMMASIIFVLNIFLTQPLAMLLGKLIVTQNEENIRVFYKFSIFKSHTYIIPKILHPELINENGRYYITCKDSYTEYYRLPLGQQY